MITDLDRKDISRLENKIDKMDGDLNAVSKTVVSIDERLKANNELQSEKLDRFSDQLKEISDEVSYMKKEDVPARLDSHERRITSLESIASKIGWAIILAVLGAVLTLVLK